MSKKETTKAKTAYIVDDDLAAAAVLKLQLEKLGFKCTVERESKVAVGYLKKNSPALIVSDLHMPYFDGIDLLKKRRSDQENAVWIIMTGEATITTSVEAIQEGADDYLLKPVNFDHLKLSIEKGFKNRSLTNENTRLKEALDTKNSRSMIGESRAMDDLRRNISKVAASDVSVMIFGESGTGKELVAREIHNQSPVAKGPFMGIDCVSLPKEIFESELFGHEEGAFTGASKAKTGLLESSANGSFFMDEITEMDYGLQAKLLRTLQERSFRKVGGQNFKEVNCRFISATRRDPQKAIDEGLFREDLFYRLSVVPIFVPPLRERKADIPILIKHFLKKTGKDIEVSSKALECLLRYDWPGNIRELENMIKRLVIFTDNSLITLEELPSEIIAYTPGSKIPGALKSDSTVIANTPQAIPEVKSEVVPVEQSDEVAATEVMTERLWSTKDSFNDAKQVLVEKFEKEYLKEILPEYNFNITEAANASGVNRKTFQRLISKYDLKSLWPDKF